MKTIIQQMLEAGIEVIPEQSDEKRLSFSYRRLTPEQHKIVMDIVSPPPYTELRRREYPPIEDFVDAYYWQMQGDSKPMDEYVKKCKAVKEKYPKE